MTSDASRTPEIIWGSVGTVLVGIGLGVAFLAPELLHLAPACVLKASTGVPCPTCGSTRAALALAGGHLGQALVWNPLAGLGLLGLSAYLPYAWLVIGNVVSPVRTGWLAAPMPVWLRWGCGLLLVTNWIYVVLAGR